MVFMIRYNYTTICIITLHQHKPALYVSDGVQEVKCWQYRDELQRLHAGASSWVLPTLLIEA